MTTDNPSNTNWKNIPIFFRTLLGGLALFNLLALLLDWNISSITELILSTYNKILTPLNIIFEPVFKLLLAEIIDIKLPEWWSHFFVLWLLIGAITVRAGASIDEKTGQKETKNHVVRLIGTMILTLMGGLLLIFALIAWIRHAIILKIIFMDEDEEDIPKRVNPYKILLKETLNVIIATGVFVIMDAFVF